MSAPKRPCLDGEGLELAYQQAQEQMERLRRQMEEATARQVAPPPAPAPPPVDNQQPAAIPQPALPAVQQPAIQPAVQHLAIQPAALPQYSPSASRQQPPPPPAQPSFDNYRGHARRRNDTRGRLFYVYVCRQHGTVFCHVCGDYISSKLYFERNPDAEY